MGGAFEWLLPRRQEAYGSAVPSTFPCPPGPRPECVSRCFRHDQMRHMDGVERAPEQRVHVAQERVALESAAAGQLRSSRAAFG